MPGPKAPGPGLKKPQGPWPWGPGPRAPGAQGPTKIQILDQIFTQNQDSKPNIEQKSKICIKNHEKTQNLLKYSGPARNDLPESGAWGPQEAPRAQGTKGLGPWAQGAVVP